MNARESMPPGDRAAATMAPECLRWTLWHCCVGALRAVVGVALGSMMLLQSAAAVDKAAEASARPAKPELQFLHPELDIIELLRSAERGDARAAYLLGTHYSSGRSGTRDDSQAVRWYSMAAERDLAEAQFNLAVMYAKGRGVQRDVLKAVRWFGLSAKQGYSPAQHALGTLYARGIGVERDEATAAAWLRKAAEQGEARSQFNLAVLYEFGRGVPVDVTQAKQWYVRAAAIGYAQAADRLKSLEDRLAAPTAEEAAPVVVAEHAPPTVRPSKGKGPRIALPIMGGTRATSTSESTPNAQVALSGKFTIQLSSHKTQGDGQAALKRYLLGQSARLVRTRVKGRAWFVVLYGGYAARKAAHAAVARLPKVLRDARPWVRETAGVRSQMK